MSEDNGTIRVLNALTSVSLEDFEDRLKLQKLVFLAREMGLDCGFTFDWYARGPYSPSLTRMLFSTNEQDRLRLERVSLNYEEKRVVERLRSFLGDDVNKPRELELLASVWYLLPKGPLSDEEKENLVTRILSNKPLYNPKEVKNAIKRINYFRRKTE